jgi:integrase
MATPSPSLYIREKNSAERWRYQRIKEGRGVKTGEISAPFFVRPFVNGKQIWKKLSAQTFKEAKEEAGQLALALDAQAKGLTVEEAEAIANSNRVPIRTAVDTYLDQKSGKAKKTVAQYRLTLNEFVESLRGKVRFLDEITEAVLRHYKRFMEAQGYAGKTIDTRLNIVFFLLKKNGIRARIPRDEMPVIEEAAAVPYTEEELEKLFAAMNEEEAVRYKFFLGTGCREKEVTFASWQDINWEKGEYHVRRKDDVGFTPTKDHIIY